MTEYCMILITTTHLNQAENLSQVLLENKLAACINIVDSVQSCFYWNKNIERSRETMMVIKTKLSLFDQVKDTVLNEHSYDVPEIIALPIVAGHDDYLNWLGDNCA